MSDRSTAAPRGIALLLAALSALGPFSIDTYLPSFPDIGASLQATPIEVQQTLSAYLFSFAAMTLWHGALADRFGRRRVILIALCLFALSCVGCLTATRIEHLWLWRAVQGITAGAGIVVSRAIVRDLFDGPAAQRLMAQISMMFALAPALAPLIGGWLQVHFGWRSVFAFLCAMTTLIVLACWRFMPETLPEQARRSLAPASLARAYATTLRHPAFLLASTALSANFCGMFIYVMSAPVFLMTHLQLPETAFLWLFGPAMLGLMAGSWLSGRLAQRARPLNLRLAYQLMAAGVVCNLLVSFLLPPGLPWSVAPLFIYMLGMAIAMPVLTLHALDPFAARRGLAASCQTFLQAGFNGVVAAIIAPLAWSSPQSLATAMALFCLVGGLATLALQRANTSEVLA